MICPDLLTSVVEVYTWGVPRRTSPPSHVHKTAVHSCLPRACSLADTQHQDGICLPSDPICTHFTLAFHVLDSVFASSPDDPEISNHKEGGCPRIKQNQMKTQWPRLGEQTPHPQSPIHPQARTHSLLTHRSPIHLLNHSLIQSINAH